MNEWDEASTEALALPGGVLRWARASAVRGDFCVDPAHAPSDYVFREPLYADTAERIRRPVPKRACGICWPRKKAVRS